MYLEFEHLNLGGISYFELLLHLLNDTLGSVQPNPVLKTDIHDLCRIDDFHFHAYLRLGGRDLDFRLSSRRSIRLSECGYCTRLALLGRKMSL